MNLGDLAIVFFALATTAVYAGGLAAIIWFTVGREVRRQRRDAAAHEILATFGPAQAAVLSDPRLLLTWYPLAQTARKIDPETFAALDAATGGTFPFTRDQVERAHAKVSSDWLAWEAAHDEEYRLKAAAAEHELTRASGDAAPLARARLDRIQREKIERYQQRYEEYIRTAKALQALIQ
jgi:hypothetical protein